MRDVNALPEDTRRWIEALTWHEMLTEADESRLTTSLIRDWQVWHADPENQRIFDHLSRLIADVGCIRQWRQPAGEDIADARYDPTVSVARWKRESAATSADRSVSRRTRWRRPTTLIAAAAAVAIVAMIFGSPWRSLALRPVGGSATYNTAIGQLKIVHLRDGSDITLGGNTSLRVEFSAANRSIDLVRGEAWFRVAHDAKWPFVVHAGDGTITAVGTAFLVTRDSDRVVVTVTQGVISIRTSRLEGLTSANTRGAAPPGRSSALRVSRGEGVIYHDNGGVASIVTADARAATAWTDGRLIFDDEPLRYVVEDISRYSPRRISVTATAGRIRFSGVILPGDIAEWLQRLPAIAPVDIDERGAEVCIRMHENDSGVSCAATR